MIIGIIILLGFLISLGGLILFIRYYLKARRDNNDNKQMLLTIETSNDDNAQYDKFYNSLSRFFRGVSWRRMFPFFAFAGLAIIIFWGFTSVDIDTESSTGNQGVQEKQINPPTPTNNVINNSESIILTDLLALDSVPFWMFIIMGAVMMWVLFKTFFRSGYDF